MNAEGLVVCDRHHDWTPEDEGWGRIDPQDWMPEDEDWGTPNNERTIVIEPDGGDK